MSQTPTLPGQPSAPSSSPRRGKNGLAIASHVAGLIGFCWLGAPIGLVLGVLALAQIRRTGESGRGLAWSGIGLSVGWLLAAAGSVAYLLAQGGLTITPTGITRPAAATPAALPVAPPVPSPTWASFALDFQVGDCILEYDPPVAGVARRYYTVVPCSTPHRGEVIAHIRIEGGDYPGDEAVREQSNACNALLMRSYSPHAAADPTLQYLTYSPDRAHWDWDVSTRYIVCVVYDRDKERTSSLKNS